MKNNVFKKVFQSFRNQFDHSGFFHLLLFAITTQYVFYIKRDLYQLLVAFGFTLILNVIIFFQENKDYQQGLKTFFVSAYIFLGVVLFFKVWNPVFYSIVCIITLVILKFIKQYKVDISYNPINLAVVLGLVLFPPATFYLNIGNFSFQTYPLMLTLLFGLSLAYFQKTWPQIVAYLSVVLTWGLIDAFFFHGSFMYWIAPEFGVFGLLFIFLILANNKLQLLAKKEIVVFGLLVGVLKVILKRNEYFFSDQIALFCITTFFNIYTLSCFSSSHKKLTI